MLAKRTIGRFAGSFGDADRTDEGQVIGTIAAFALAAIPSACEPRPNGSAVEISAAIDPRSAEAARQVVERYRALLEQKKQSAVRQRRGRLCVGASSQAKGATR